MFRSLFRGRDDIYALRWHSEKTQKSGYSPACGNEWVHGLCEKGRISCSKCSNRSLLALTDNVLYRHLAGKDPLSRDVVGLYPMLADETCFLLALDFDDANWQECARAVADLCKKQDIPFALERSRSGQGAHLWIFFSEPVPCARARALGDALLTAAMARCNGLRLTAYDRMFPNQDTLPAGGFGNLIALPLQGRARREGNSVFLDDQFLPYPDPWAFLAKVKHLSPAQVESMIFELCPAGATLGILAAQEREPAEEAASIPKSTPWKHPPVRPLAPSDFSNLPLQIVRADGLYIEKQALTPAARNRLIRLAAFQNPEFYKKQALHLSTHQTPRVISTATEEGAYLHLPRGCEESLIALLGAGGIPYSISDETMSGRPLCVSFIGELRPDQQPAADAMLQHHTGVLSATTAFGKTVIAAYMIAQRKVNTLILVHRQNLLHQWVQAMSNFLRFEEELPPSPKRRGRGRQRSFIGRFGSGKDTREGFVDIAILQSLTSSNQVHTLVRNYGMVIVDECHHVSAAGFEQVLWKINARFVHGLTATPTRPDGHGPIITLQCEPIRYRVSAKEQAARQEFSRILIPRFTRFSCPITTERLDYADTCTAMAKDVLRNQLILSDACAVLAEGRTPLLLTERLEHAQILYQLLSPHCTNTFLLSGKGSAKEKRTLLEALHAVPDGAPLAVIAIGKYAGEGFDLPRLDTLLLTMPIVWKGTLAQYVGRLHRPMPNKNEVRIYDYVDLRVPMLEHMYHKRLPSYTSLAYTIKTAAVDSSEQMPPAIITAGNELHNSIGSNLDAAQKEILICAPYLVVRSLHWLFRHLDCIHTRGVRIQIYAPSPQCFKPNLQPKITAAIQLLSAHGIPVMLCQKMLPCFCIIDSNIVWYGSANPLGYPKAEESNIRMLSHTLAAELMDYLHNISESGTQVPPSEE